MTGVSKAVIESVVSGPSAAEGPPQRVTILGLSLTQRQWMALIFLIAVGLRAAQAWLSYGPDHLYNGEAERIAQSIARGDGFGNPYAIPTGPTAHCGPFYPNLLAIVYFFLGTGTAAVLARIAMLITVNAIGCAALPVVGTALGLPAWCGVGAGLFAAIVPMHRTAETFNAWDEPYAALGLMAALGLFLAWRPLQERGWGALAAYGALWGVLLYLAAPLLPVLLGLAASAVLAARPKIWLEVRRWMVVGGMVFLVLLPWTVRNRIELGGWIFQRSIFGLEFHISNTDNAGLLGNSRTHPSYNVSEAEKVRSMGEIAYNHERMAMAVQWIREHRGEFALMTAGRFASFWLGWWGNPETAAIFSLTTLFGACGAWFLWRDGKRNLLRIFASVWISYPLIYYIVVYSPRYRIAMWWTVLLTASYGVGRIVATLRSPAGAIDGLPPAGARREVKAI